MFLNSLFLRKFSLIFLTIVFLSSYFHFDVYASKEAIVKADNVNVRSGPGLNYEVIGKIHRGEKFPIIEEKDSWVKISFNQNEGWVANWLIETNEFKQIKIKTAEANVANLNVRNGPSTSFTVIDQINPETRYPVLEIEGDWVKIQINSNKTGWVAKWLITITEEEPSEKTLQNEKLTIQAEILNVRSGPSTDYPAIGKLKKGDQVEVISIEQGWYKIKLGEVEGWIASEFVGQQSDPTAPNEQPEENKVIVNTTTLNVRSGPGLNYEVAGQLKQNDILIVIEENGDWLKVKKSGESDSIGWVANWLVIKYNQVITNQPIVTILNPGTNLREGPSTSAKVISRGNIGDEFPILDTVGDWYLIQLPDGRKAYVAGWIVAVKGINQNISHGINKILEDKVIVIDAGHGGKDNGATGVHFKTIEKNLNLAIAKRLQKKLEAAGAKVIMTRKTDVKISLQQRVDISINNTADAFISIHHNTNSNTNINGTITYYNDEQDKRLALIIQKELIKATRLNDLKARYGNYFVLRENRTVSILAELAFISNYHDEIKARTEPFQESAAEGLFQGIIKYFNQ